MMKNIPTHIDITPTPRALRMMGEIPFAEWQCFAELIDNSVDAIHAEDRRTGGTNSNVRSIEITWDSQRLALAEQTVTIADTGPGMSLNEMQKAVRLGYSSNDPVNNLGLFGVGFNIATAKLGDKTTVLSSKKGDDQWVGIIIDFRELQSGNGEFSAPTITTEKKDTEEHGTKIIISDLRENQIQKLNAYKAKIKKQLGDVYSRVLTDSEKIEITVQGEALTPKRPCIWHKSRQVKHQKFPEPIEAVQEIDKDFGEAFFNVAENRYLTVDERDQLIIDHPDGAYPGSIIERKRRLKGWIGVQRFTDVNEFGISFIRNGRKILINDKCLFNWVNPETGAEIKEYPVNLGDTVGGRIVGELEVDYLHPTYQKNDFDKNDKAWRLTVEAVRGQGPIRDKNRRSHGYGNTTNNSPLGKLWSAFNRNDPGTKCLFVKKEKSIEYYKRFLAGDQNYQDDSEWWKWTQQEDQRHEPAAPSGPATNVTLIPGGGEAPNTINPVPTSTAETTTTNELRSNRSTKDNLLSGEYKLSLNGSRAVTTVWKLSHNETIKVEGKKVPYIGEADGQEYEFFYDPSHSLFKDYILSARQVLVIVLANHFHSRHKADGLEFHQIIDSLYSDYMEDEKIVPETLHQAANDLLDRIKTSLSDLLNDECAEAISVIKKEHETEFFSAVMEMYPSEGNVYITENNPLVLDYCPNGALPDLIRSFPEAFFNENLFKHDLCGLPENIKEAVSEQIINNISRLVEDMVYCVAESQGRNEDQDSKTLRVRLQQTIEHLREKMV